MFLLRRSLVLFTFALAGGLAFVAANYSATVVEEQSEIDIRGTLDRNGLTWAEVEADGLRVIMAGIAPTEALRFRALSLAGSVVDAARVIDDMEVAAVEALEPPRFSAEILRNTAGVSIIGLIPVSTDRDALLEGFAPIDSAPVTDLLEAADYPAPTGWEDALAFAMLAVRELPRSKVSVDAGRVAITAIAENAENKADMEAQLKRDAPPSLMVSLNISAPRPVISPFTLRFVKDTEGAHFDACSADTAEAQEIIVKAAARAGLTETSHCKLGMGVPTPTWAEAASTAMNALAEIGYGSVTLSDAEVTLDAAEGTDPAVFDRVIGELETALPPLFVLNARLPLDPAEGDGPLEFIATLSPEGQVQLRGRIGGENMREIADSFAKAKFGSENVYTATRNVSGLPTDWSRRVLTGIEALGYMDSGFVTVTPDKVELAGRSGYQEASDTIARLVVDKLGDAGSFNIDVAYVEALDPNAALPSPEECQAEIREIVTAQKITFEPGSATIDESALSTMDQIAQTLENCGGLRLEVQGHTDSQGREEMNLSLSQARAESVLNELRARRVLTSTFAAKGYGETQPIADNETEEGREANRRIEFRLISSEPSVPQGDSTLESIAENSDTEEPAE